MLGREEWLIPRCGRRSRAVHEASLIIRGRFSEGFVFEHADIAYDNRRGHEGRALGGPAVVRARSNDLLPLGGLMLDGERGSELDRCTWRGLPSLETYTWASIANTSLLMLARHALH